MKKLTYRCPHTLDLEMYIEQLHNIPSATTSDSIAPGSVASPPIQELLINQPARRRERRLRGKIKEAVRNGRRHPLDRDLSC